MEDNVFIGTNELIIGGVGIGIALVLLVILSLLQTSRAKREGQERLDKLTEKGAALPDSAPGETPFFVACYRGNNPRFFRVYMGAQELLFLYAGQYYAMIDAESPRGQSRLRRRAEVHAVRSVTELFSKFRNRRDYLVQT